MRSNKVWIYLGLIVFCGTGVLWGIFQHARQQQQIQRDIWHTQKRLAWQRQDLDTYFQLMVQLGLPSQQEWDNLSAQHKRFAAIVYEAKRIPLPSDWPLFEQAKEFLQWLQRR